MTETTAPAVTETTTPALTETTVSSGAGATAAPIRLGEAVVLAVASTGRLMLGPAGSLGIAGPGSDAVAGQLIGRPGVALMLAEAAEPLHFALPVGAQIADALPGPRRAARDRAIDLLELADIPEPQRRVNARPHELTRLERQRVQLALGLANRPALLVVQDPGAGLGAGDVAALAATLRRLQAQLRFALLVVTPGAAGSIGPFIDELVILDAGGISQRMRRRGTGPEAA